MRKKRRLISAMELVRKYGLTYQTINHYTNFGLLPVVAKDGNIRMYDAAKVKARISKIAHLSNEGYSLRLIRKKLIGI